MEAQRIRATHHYNKLIHGFDKKSNLRETWRAWKPVDQVHIPEWRQIGLNISKSITGIIGSIRKLTTEYFDIYGLEVKRDALNLDYVVETGGSMSDGVQSVIDSEPDDIMKIGDPLFSEKCIYAFHSTNEKYEQSILHPTFLFG